MKNKLKKLLSVILAVAIATAGIQLSNLEVHADFGASFNYGYNASTHQFHYSMASCDYFTMVPGDTWNFSTIYGAPYVDEDIEHLHPAGHVFVVSIAVADMTTDGSGYHPEYIPIIYFDGVLDHKDSTSCTCSSGGSYTVSLPSAVQLSFTAYKEYVVLLTAAESQACFVTIASQEYLDYVAAGGDPAGGVPTAGTSHNHSYKWDIIQKGSPETDQIETQICSSCGAKGSTKTTPAYTFFLTDAKNKLSAKTTPAGGTVSLTSKTVNVFSKSLMEEIAKRKDVNVVLTYKYDGKNVQVTIPAGTAIDTTCDYYGPVKMMSLYGYKLLDTFPGEIKASSIAEINDAVKGATVTLKGKNSYNVSDMLAISNRRDINVDLEVAYSGKTYVIHIPAGATVDVNSEWYGPLKLMSLYSFTTK